MINPADQSLTRGTSHCPSGRSLHHRMLGTQPTCNSLTPDTQGMYIVETSEMKVFCLQRRKAWPEVPHKEKGNISLQLNSNHTCLVGRGVEAEGAAHIQGFTDVSQSSSQIITIIKHNHNHRKSSHIITIITYHYNHHTSLLQIWIMPPQVSVAAQHRLSTFGLSLVVREIRREEIWL